MENDKLFETYLNEISQEKKTESLIAADIAKMMKLDDNSINSCLLLYPYIEGKIDSKEEILNDDTKELLYSIKKLREIKFNNKEEEAENIRKMFFAISKDVRVILIKLAFVVAKIRNLGSMKEEESAEYCSLVLDLYAPLANRLGLSIIKGELEDTSFKILQRERYLEIEKQVDERLATRESTINSLKSGLQEALDELGIKGKITGRRKHIYSIHKKMLNKELTIDKIYDLFAVRAILKSIPDCYALLGKVSSDFMPLQNKFKDYIAIPKSNGYQSLHTTVMFEGVPVEIQIRTEDMHKAAEFGVAAHWMYKEKRDKMDSLDKKLGWIRQLMDESENLSAQDYIDSLKVNIYDGEIFVQTPKGKVLHLPEHAIPIDFAYMIHSDIGNKCVGAKINGKMKTLTTPLNNGDIVEIITSPNSKGPSMDWLKLVKTVEARNKIRTFFRKEMKEENIKTGRTMIESTAKTNGIPLAKLLEGGREGKLLEKYYLVNFDEICAAIGRGSLSATSIYNYLVNEYKRETKNDDLLKQTDNKQIRYKYNSSTVNVHDTDNLMINFARCCSPVPGDGIIGYISYGRGIVVHRKTCPNLKGFEDNRLIEVEWNNTSGEFVSNITLLAKNKNHIFQIIAGRINDFKINLKTFNVKSTIADKVTISMQIVVKSQNELNHLIEKLEAMEEVIQIYRN